MPEIAEVARIVHFLKKHAVGKVVANVKVQDDNIVYGKVGTSASEFQKAISGKKILDARQQGKYFWLVMDSAPHPLMHFGMSGWMKFSNDHTTYYRPTKPEENEWPPKFWKFILQLKDDDCEVAFVDARRLARIRLVDAKAEDMRKTTPLKENGPDPVLDPNILTVEWLGKKLRSKRVPVKALLLDQANISGIGNWVGDEIMYQARLHPEQYSNTFSDDQVKKLHDAMMYVCNTACDALGDSDQFPTDWLMKHRWGKGKKDGNKLPNGAKITFLKVGGRTSAIVPSVQKKTGTVAGDVSDDTNAVEEDDEELKEKPKPKTGTKRAKVEEDDDDAPTITAPKAKRGRKVTETANDVKDKAVSITKDSKSSVKSKVKSEDVGGQRRSSRLTRS